MTAAARVATLAACALAAGCSGGDPPAGAPGPDAANSDMTVAEAAAVRGTPLFWLGEGFEGLPLTTISGDGVLGASFTYGDCRIPPGRTDGGCAPPLQIQTILMCPGRIPRRPLEMRRTLRGVPAGSGGGGIVLLSHRVEIRVFADGGGRGRRAVALLRAVNPGAPGAVGAGEPFPPPPPGAEARTPCPPPTR